MISPTRSIPKTNAPILIVDDSAASRSVLADIIENIPDCDVTLAANGPEALDKAQGKNFAAILLDIEMPGMDGFQIAEKLGAMTPPVGPILFITGLDLNDEMIDRAYAVGALDFIHKPVRPAVLHAKIRGYCNQYWQHHQLIAMNARLSDVSHQAQNASQAKTFFVANMSHEIRTPLNGILGTVDLLRKTKLDENQKRYTDIIISSGEALLGIVNDILDLAKIEAGRTTVQPTTFDLDAFLKTVTEPHLPRAASNRVELMLRMHRSVPTQITTDPQLLKQILFNLLSNAVKFTKSGSVILDIDKPNEHRLRFSVIDTGIGIPPDRLNEVFDIFTQVDPSTTRDHGGTGLGLAITRHLVHLLDGIIRVKSEQGKGTTFWVDLPIIETPPLSTPFTRPVVLIAPDDMVRDVLAGNLHDIGVQSLTFLDEPSGHRIESLYATDALVIMRRNLILNIDPTLVEDWARRLGPRLIWLEGSTDMNGLSTADQTRVFYALHQRTDLRDLMTNQDQKPSPCLDEAGPITTKGSILLVEDDPVNRMIATEILEQLGYTVAIAENGLKAVEKARLAQYDAILMDCMMPNMDGYQATQLIRSTENMNQDTPIIALTASVMESDRQKALASGMNDFLSKPFRRQDLAEKLESARTPHD